MHKGIAMKRILGKEDKNRVRVHLSIEKEFITRAKECNIHLSDKVNVLLEKELFKNGL